MRPVVMKFGGTSVADASAISRVVRIVSEVAAAGAPVVVVVSAMSGITDELLTACELARKGDVDDVKRRVDVIEARHQGVVDGIFGCRPLKSSAARAASAFRRKNCTAASPGNATSSAPS